MHRNRLSEMPPVYRLPQPPDFPPSPTAFVWWPMALLPGQTAEQLAFQQWLYRQALEQAQAAARPSLPERDVLGVWN